MANPIGDGEAIQVGAAMDTLEFARRGNKVVTLLQLLAAAESGGGGGGFISGSFFTATAPLLAAAAAFGFLPRPAVLLFPAPFSPW